MSSPVLSDSPTTSIDITPKRKAEDAPEASNKKPKRPTMWRVTVTNTTTGVRNDQLFTSQEAAHAFLKRVLARCAKEMYGYGEDYDLEGLIDLVCGADVTRVCKEYTPHEADGEVDSDEE